MDIKAPEELDPKPRVLEEVQQPAVGELSIGPPTVPPEELDASPMTLEIGSPRSPIEERQGIAEPEMSPDEERVIGEPDVAVDKERTVMAPDATEDEEIRIGESIRTGDE